MGGNILTLPLNLIPEDTYPFLGIRPDNVPDKLQELITRYLRAVTRLARARGIWKIFTVGKVTGSRICIKDSLLLIEGEKTAAHFSTCEKVSLFAVTIGSEVEKFLEELSQNKPGHALIFDGVASAAAENAAEHLDSLLSREIRRQGFFPTARFSPGYGDWPLSRQRSFLDSIEADKIKLTCTSHFLLQPVKSVTAAIGWSKVPVERNYLLPTRTRACQNREFCKHCHLTSCPDRV